MNKTDEIVHGGSDMSHRPSRGEIYGEARRLAERYTTSPAARRAILMRIEDALIVDRKRGMMLIAAFLHVAPQWMPLMVDEIQMYLAPNVE